MITVKEANMRYIFRSSCQEMSSLTDDENNLLYEHVQPHNTKEAIESLTILTDATGRRHTYLAQNTREHFKYKFIFSQRKKITRVGTKYKSLFIG